MNVVYPNAGLVYLLQRLAGGLPDSADGLTWFLYGNDYEPVRTSVLTDFDLLDSEFGNHTYDYSDLVVTGVSANVGIILRNEALWLNSSGGTVDVYGWVITNIAETKLLAAARLDGAPFAVADGTSITTIPELSARSLFPL